VERYDAMVLAIAAAHSIDEIKGMMSVAAALEKYAAIAVNIDSELRAQQIRLRAERRAGEILREMKASGERDSGGKGKRKIELPKGTQLAELGVTKKQSSDWQQMAGMDTKTFEQRMDEGIAERKRITKKQIVREARPKRDLAAERRQLHATLALRTWGSLKAVLRLTEEATLKEVVQGMDLQLTTDVAILIQKVRVFLDALEKENEKWHAELRKKSSKKK
jgi:hypothetical protein